MENTMRLFSHPAVSGVLLPIVSSGEGPTLDLSVGSDYRLGKLIRSGLDAVHGLDATGCREYDPRNVRSGLPKIDTHIGNRKDKNASPRALIHQGHGNIGLNNYAVAYKCGGNGIIQMVLPAGEPLHERIYPCFVKTRGLSGLDYAIEDLIFFAEDRHAFSQDQVVAWDHGTGTPRGATMAAHPYPDRELLGNDVYIPIWNENLRDKALARVAEDERIDWGKMEQPGVQIEFARVSRTCQGMLENVRLRLVAVTPGDAGPLIGPALDGVELAFFGIPVESLNKRDGIGEELSRNAHYFYDLRHLIDLIGVGQPEFYLLEYDLKRDGYRRARKLLRSYRDGYGPPDPLLVDIEELYTIVEANDAHPGVLGTLKGYLGDDGTARLIDDLQCKGYQHCATEPPRPVAGDFYIGGSHRHLTVWPRRNTYSYSFIGLITAPDDMRYVLLAVTGGHGGLRPPGGYFERALVTGLSLETAVRAVFQHLAAQWGTGNTDVAPHHDDRLLLLDQGGDVHQWIGAGGLGYVIGSTEGRALMSALLTVLTP